MKLKLTIDGRLYEVDVETADGVSAGSSTQQSHRQPVPRSPWPAADTSPAIAPTAVPDGAKVCRSPISGVVVRVSTQPGQKVSVHDELMVLEAMKMETVITSPLDGQVARVNVGPGDPIQGGQVLVVFQ